MTPINNACRLRAGAGPRSGTVSTLATVGRGTAGGGARDTLSTTGARLAVTPLAGSVIASGRTVKEWPQREQRTRCPTVRGFEVFRCLAQCGQIILVASMAALSAGETRFHRFAVFRYFSHHAEGRARKIGCSASGGRQPAVCIQQPADARRSPIAVRGSARSGTNPPSSCPDRARCGTAFRSTPSSCPVRFATGSPARRRCAGPSEPGSDRAPCAVRG